MANNLRITLTSSYRDNYVFWPVVELVRRFVFITAVVATPGDLVCTKYSVFTCYVVCKEMLKELNCNSCILYLLSVLAI